MTIPYNPLEYMLFTVHCPFGQFRRKNPSAGLYLHVSALVGEVARRCGSPTRDEFKADVRDGSINQRNYDKLRYSLVVIYRLYRLHILTFLYVYIGYIPYPLVMTNRYSY